MFTKFSKSFLYDFDFNYLLEKFDDKQFLSFKKGAFIYRRADLIENIYFILTGEVCICDFDELIPGKQICKAGSGEIIGLEDLLISENYYNSAYVVEESNIFAVAKNDFARVISKTDEFNLWILKYLSTRIGELELKK